MEPNPLLKAQGFGELRVPHTLESRCHFVEQVLATRNYVAAELYVSEGPARDWKITKITSTKSKTLNRTKMRNERLDQNQCAEREIPHPWDCCDGAHRTDPIQSDPLVATARRRWMEKSRYGGSNDWLFHGLLSVATEEERLSFAWRLHLSHPTAQIPESPEWAALVLSMALHLFIRKRSFRPHVWDVPTGKIWRAGSELRVFHRRRWLRDGDL